MRLRDKVLVRYGDYAGQIGTVIGLPGPPVLGDQIKIAYIKLDTIPIGVTVEIDLVEVIKEA